MPQTRTTCPRCRQPILVNLEQLFDMNVDPEAKQKLLSGSVNVAHCQNCGYEGPVSSPLVYHDPEKELLLTYFPSEMGLPVNEQERLIGPLITQVVNRLPNEKRKAYLFRPQTMLTMQTMIEKILEADGITKEMIQGQQQRLNLLQRLLALSPESRPEVIQQEEALVDQELLSILSRLLEVTMMQGDRESAQQLAILQNDILTHTEYGRQVKKEAEETENAIKSLQEASQKGLTREKLLELLLETKSDTSLTALVSMARSGLDYNFFQILTERIDHAVDDEKQKLSEFRDKLLTITQEIDLQIQDQLNESKKLLDSLLAASNIEEETAKHLPEISDIFGEVLKAELQTARQNSDLEKLAKLQKIITVIQSASAPSPEIELVQELLEADQEEKRRAVLTAHKDQITPEFIQLLNNLVAQSEADHQQPEIINQLKEISRLALRFSMETNFLK
jgi:hypothetical protein